MPIRRRYSLSIFIIFALLFVVQVTRGDALENTSSHPLYVEAACAHGCGFTEDKSWEEKLRTDPVASFTAVLALLTLGLIIVGTVQARRLRQTFKSYVSGEAAYIFAVAPEGTRFLPHGSHAMYPTLPGVPLPIVSMCVANVGRTSCAIKTMRAEILIGENLPTRPEYAHSTERVEDLVCLSNAQSSPFEFAFDRNLTVAEINEIGVGTTPIYIFGYIKYVDIFDRLHTKGFCYRVAFTQQTAVGRRAVASVAGGACYNYRTNRKAPPDMAM